MRLKTLLVAAIAALALVALVGAGSASATVLCGTTPAPCPSPAPSGTNIFGVLDTSTSAVLTTSGGSLNPTITCNTSNVTVQTTGAGGTGATLPGKLTALSFSNCSSVNPSGCSSSATVGSLSGATGHADWTSGANGTLTLTTPQVSFTCTFFGFPIVCTFGGSGGNTVTGNVTGGNPAKIAFSSVSLPASGSGGGFFCPTAAQWTATYKSVTTSGGSVNKAWYLFDH